MTDELIERLRSWPAITQGDALSASTVALLMEEAADRLQSLSDRIAVLEGAASALVAKLDECAPHVANLTALNYVRSGVQYTGPSYGEALEALRSSLIKEGRNV